MKFRRALTKRNGRCGFLWSKGWHRSTYRYSVMCSIGSCTPLVRDGARNLVWGKGGLVHFFVTCKFTLQLLQMHEHRPSHEKVYSIVNTKKILPNFLPCSLGGLSLPSVIYQNLLYDTIINQIPIQFSCIPINNHSFIKQKRGLKLRLITICWSYFP